ncbi:gfo/Idh/MocA family oxidoreductase [Rhodohalobacter sp. SW132]|uniref:Gfo/Idh/MocA family protein n=1 Tax=Rhodohalobacter sp. SW132 TaxID=2293433 RepID=UPI000E24F3B7|nr:Gfo/Idh/MocA family oxidoreductase [Rhodohalobacter sp. SW132]REL39314.1 gfo/Idh/MocA family oxidoreductase [Rhodohalobacter sp. SW132]
MKRRTFLKKSALGAAAMAGSFYMPAFGKQQKIKVGLIGAGWYGMVISEAALDVGGVEIVAVCDVDTEHLNNSASRLDELQGSRPQTFADYRDLLEVDGLEAVFIATPPQWHALQFIDACEKGLDIFLEKPLSYDPMEGVAMVEAAEKADNIVAIGFQRRHSAAFKHAQQFIQDGKAGEIHKVVAQIHYRANAGDTTIQDPPESLDWDAWCGPAPKLSYRPSIGHFNWRLEKEYGNGHLSDWGIHHIDIIRRTLGLSIPDRIHATGGIYALKDQITTPDTLNATMQFGDLPVVWQHRMWGSLEENPDYNNGIFYHGDKASLFVSDNRFITWQTGDENRKKEMQISTEGGMQQLHMKEFIDAVKSHDESGLSSKVQDAFLSSATVQLAAISYETGSVVEWDHQEKTIRNNPEAAALLKRDYRSPWQHPG